MSTYLIGDVHGCYDELIALLAQVEFDPRRDTLWLTGDLVARGPGSLEVLRYVKSLGDSVRLVLGNHDLHLLAVFAGISRNKPKDRLKPLLEAPDADELLNWLRRQPLLQVDEEKKLVMAHAGITPQWDLETAQQCARDVEAVLSSDSYPFFLDAMYGDMPNHWSNELSGLARLRFISNAFTRMRYCFPNGQLDMYSKEAPEDAPAPLKPWFAIPGPVSNAYSIAFGHWASLEGRGTPEGIYALDTGCCWGGELTCEDEARDGKHDEILSAPSSRNSCKRKPRSRQTRPGFFYRYPARLTAFEDLKAVAMGVLRVGVMKLAEHRLPFVRIVIREMGIAFHFRINMGQVELLRFRQELLIHPAAADHHNLFHIAAGGNCFFYGGDPLHAIVAAGFAADHDIFTPRQWAPNGFPGQTPHHHRLI